MQASSAIFADFVRKFSELEEENAALKQSLQSEKDAHISTKNLLSSVMQQLQSDPDRKPPGESGINAIQNADMKEFAQKSIAFCDQMRAFASHILNQSLVQDPDLAEVKSDSASADSNEKISSPERSEQAGAEKPVDSEPTSDHEEAPGAPGQDAWIPDSTAKFDPDNKHIEAQLLRLERDFERLLREHSNKIELNSLFRLYFRRFHREPTAFPNTSLEDTIRAFPGGIIHIESTELGQFVILRSSKCPSQERTFSRSEVRISRQTRRSRSRSPRSSRNASRGRSRSQGRERFVRNFSKSNRGEEGHRPTRSFYRFARSQDGSLVCIYYNSRTCPNKPCSYAHICGQCGKSSHGMRTCPSLQQDGNNMTL
uniref:Uncharacterized protein n=1 Tax=Spongospora subterranea TaxID=70186 RepID=A0A0H5RNR6_9EUKA|eukprot:CRZ10374.1 hypothetical protein [Spongospora subterranea]